MENKKLAILVSILNKLWKFSWPIIRRAHWEHWVILVLSMFIFIQNFNWIFSGGEISKEKKEVKVERVCGLDSVASLPCRGQLNVDFDILADYLSWPPEEHDMFRRVYPLTHSVRAIHEAVEFAKDHGYDLLRIDTVERGESPRTLRVVYVRTLKEVLYE